MTTPTGPGPIDPARAWADQPEPGRSGTEQSGTEQSGTEESGTEQSGAERSGAEQSGAEQSDAGRAGHTTRLLRRGLLGLAALSVLAIAFELAAERHWNNAVQLIPWAVLVVLVAAIGCAGSSRPKLIKTARVLAGLALAASAFGIYEHVADNYQVGEMDAVYSDSWMYRSILDRIYLAFTKSVGAAPPIAPGALGQAGLLVLLATIGRGGRAARNKPGK